MQARVSELETDSINVGWSQPSGEHGAYELGLLRVHTAAAELGVWHVAEKEWDWTGTHVKQQQQQQQQQQNNASAASTTAYATLHSLNHSSTYYVKVRRAGGSSAPSDPVRLRTAAPGMMYTTTHRISEYVNRAPTPLPTTKPFKITSIVLSMLTCTCTTRRPLSPPFIHTC